MELRQGIKTKSRYWRARKDKDGENYREKSLPGFRKRKKKEKVKKNPDFRETSKEFCPTSDTTLSNFRNDQKICFNNPCGSEGASTLSSNKNVFAIFSSVITEGSKGHM